LVSRVLSYILVKRIIYTLALFCGLFSALVAQEKEPKVWKLYSLSAGYMGGSVQFFDGYNVDILYANARSGLPLYPDWNVFSQAALMPEWWQAGAQVGIVDTTGGLRLRFGLNFAHKHDSMSYVSGFAVNDTIYGRDAGEEYNMFSATFAGIRSTRKLFNFLRVYIGAEMEVGLIPGSDIRFLEYSYDFGDQRIVDLNRFEVEGKARLNLFGSALVGVETMFAKRFGFSAEVKSGIGIHLVINENTIGLSKTGYFLSLNYYFRDYKNRKPSPVLREEVLPAPE